METLPLETEKLVTTQRDETLHQLFGTDYDFLRDNGDLDLFYFNPDTDEDGLLHTLIGDDEGGFHSESAVQILGLNHPSRPEVTRVTREHLKNRNSKERRPYVEKSFEPFAANVIIRGVKKYKVNMQNTSAEPKAVRNGMYPNEYDPVAVVRTIATAYKERDEAKDEIIATSRGDILINREAPALLLDGESSMFITLAMDPMTKKVKSAYPAVARSGKTNLTDEEVEKHLGSANIIIDVNN